MMTNTTNKAMRKAYKEAINKMIKADCALQTYASHLRFDGFDGFKPVVGFVSEGCIAVVYNGAEIDGEEAILIMESKGYITPDDF